MFNIGGDLEINSKEESLSPREENLNIRTYLLPLAGKK